MIAVLGGSAEIVSWPHKVVLCAAEVSISLRRSDYFSKRFLCRSKYFSKKILGRGEFFSTTFLCRGEYFSTIFLHRGEHFF